MLSRTKRTLPAPKTTSLAKRCFMWLKLLCILAMLPVQVSSFAQQLYPYSLPYLNQEVQQYDGIFEVFFGPSFQGESRIIVSATSFSDGEITPDEFFDVVFNLNGFCVTSKMNLCDDTDPYNIAMVQSIDHVSITLDGAKGFLGGSFSLTAAHTQFPNIIIDLTVNYSEDFLGGTYAATTSNNTGSINGTGYGHVYFDADFDGRTDVYENCSMHQNPSQQDTDGDGLGNACDPDFNNDCRVDFLDFALFAQAFGSEQELFDLNDDTAVNFSDFAVVTQFFGSRPGPSGSLSPNICWEP